MQVASAAFLMQVASTGFLASRGYEKQGEVHVKQIFNQSNLFFRVMDVVGDLIVLNVLVLFCSLPIITIGPALAALHTVLRTMIKREEGSIVREFFHAFGNVFKQACLAWLGIMAVTAVLVVDYLAVRSGGLQEFLAQFDGFASLSTVISPVMLGLITLLASMLIAVAHYLFVLIAVFDASLSNQFTNACKLAFAYLLRTVLIVAVCVGLLLLYFNFFLYAAPVVLFVGIALPEYCVAWLLNDVCDRLARAA